MQGYPGQAGATPDFADSVDTLVHAGRHDQARGAPGHGRSHCCGAPNPKPSRPVRCGRLANLDPADSLRLVARGSGVAPAGASPMRTLALSTLNEAYPLSLCGRPANRSYAAPRPPLMKAVASRSSAFFLGPTCCRRQDSGSELERGTHLLQKSVCFCEIVPPAFHPAQ